MKLSAVGEKVGAFVLMAAAALLLGSTLRVHGAGTDCSNPTAQNLVQIGLATTQYEEDADEKLPVVHTQADFQVALRPFVSSSSVFISPETGQPFVFNLALSGHSITQYPDTGTTELARESPPPPNQSAAILYLDGHVERGGVEVGNPAMIVVNRAKILALGVTQYTQDYDQTFPPMNTPAEFQAAVMPYVHDSRCFYTPSGAAFVPNPALSGQIVISVSSPAATVLLSEPPPYVGGLDTVAYVDGHVTRGGIERERYPASDTVAARAGQLGLALTQYTQDFDEKYPPMQTRQVFQAALEPFTKSAAVFFSPTGSPFIPNPALSGVSLASLDSPATTVLFHDVPPYVDGNPTTCYADGHVEHQQAIVPDPTIPRPPHLLWDRNDGQIALWTLDDGGFTQTQYGPSTDWTAQALAVGPDLVQRLLWTQPSGMISIGGMTDAFGSYTSQEYGPYTGWTAKTLAVGPDNAVHLLWTDTHNQLSLWSIAADSTFTHQEYGPYLQWTARSLSVDPINHVHVLWTRTDGTVSLWDVDAFGIPAYRNFGPYSGWSALSLVSGPDGYSHILWNRTDKTLSLWTTGTDGTFGHQEYGPFPGWTAQGLTVGSDNQVRVLWSNTNGMASLWNVDCRGRFQFSNYGPYSGWTAQSLSGDGDLN